MTLNPNTKHEDYAEYSPKWDKCSDVIEGEDAVHKSGEKYLPKLLEQSAPDYASYVMRTPFYNATARTVDGLVGMLFRKSPVIDLPSSLDAIKNDITLTGCDVNEMAEEIAREVIGFGRMGVLVEYPQVSVTGITQATASQLNLRPYATTYEADSIINWRCDRVNNAMQPVMIALSEECVEWANHFESVEIEQIRALLLENGAYLQRLYRQNDKKEWVQFGTDIIPLMNNKPLSYIPFVFFGANNNSADIDQPPLYDLVTLNLSHYRTTADYEHGCHFTGLPTAVVSGYQAESNEKLSIGSSAAWIFPDPSAKASYLEFTGQGLGALESNLRAKEQAMASLGARMLTSEKTGVEAQGTVKLRHSGENAVLSSIANLISSGMTRVLAIMAEWSNVTNANISMLINKDFVDAGLTAQELTSLIGAWQGGAISSETLYWNLKQGELIEAGRTFEQEQDAILTQQPQLGSTGGA